MDGLRTEGKSGGAEPGDCAYNTEVDRNEEGGPGYRTPGKETAGSEATHEASESRDQYEVEQSRERSRRTYHQTPNGVSCDKSGGVGISTSGNGESQRDLR